MEKNFLYIELFDIYGELLTEKQKKIFSAYYIYDLSLSEIAEPDGKTRQSVHEAIKSVCDKLVQYEKTLKIYEKNQKLLALSKELGEDVAVKINEIIGK